MSLLVKTGGGGGGGLLRKGIELSEIFILIIFSLPLSGLRNYSNIYLRSLANNFSL